MNYLFGDSTPSPFSLNFIELLRLTLDFSVHVLEVEAHVTEQRERRTALERTGAIETQRLEELLRDVERVLDKQVPDTESSVERAANAMRAKAQQIVDAEAKAVRSKIGVEFAELEERIRAARKGELKPLERLLLKYDLPQSSSTLRLSLGENMQYAASLESNTPYGLQTKLELAIPESSLFAHDVRVEQLVEALELHAPETAGWIRKESRMVPQKLGRYHITEVVLGEADSVIKLRSAPEPNAAGFDVAIHATSPRVSVAKHVKDEPPLCFDVEAADVQSLLGFHAKLVEATKSIRANRRALAQALVAGHPLEQTEEMIKLLEQLIEQLAPAVREISAHSLSPNELVLRKRLEQDRREEVFVSKAELRDKLAPLNDQQRELFAPLGLFEPGQSNGARVAGAAAEIRDSALEVHIRD